MDWFNDIIDGSEDAYGAHREDVHRRKLIREAEQRGLTLEEYKDELREEAGMAFNEDTQEWEWPE